MRLFNNTQKSAVSIITGVLLGSLSATVLANDGKPTLYGRIHVTLDHFDTEGASAAVGNGNGGKDQWEVNSLSSRLGVRGALDLEDSGLTAIYVAEYGINADRTAPSPFGQRNIYVGLKGNFGTLTVGHNDTPFKSAEGKIDQFNDLIAADLDALVGGQNRVDNLVTYSSPTFSDMIINVAFAPGERGVDADGNDNTTDNDGIADLYSVSLVFDNKTLYAALAYDGNQQARRGVDLFNDSRVNAVRAVGKFTQNNFEVGALLQQSKGAGKSGARATAPTVAPALPNDVFRNSDTDFKDTALLISGAYKIDKTKFKIQAGQNKGSLSDAKTTLLALGPEYALSSKTTAHFYLSQQKIDAPAGDLKDKGFGLGVGHSF